MSLSRKIQWNFEKCVRTEGFVKFQVTITQVHHCKFWLSCILYVELTEFSLTQLISRISYRLKLNDLCLFVCLFVCAELIEELARATDLKFGILVEHVVATNKFQDLSDISTNFWERWQNVWPIRSEGFTAACTYNKGITKISHCLIKVNISEYFCLIITDI